jgi:hypothetical protein
MEQEQNIDSLASQVYGRGRLRRNTVGEWYWVPEAGGRVYLGWTLSGAEHRLRAAMYAGNGRSMSPRA